MPHEHMLTEDLKLGRKAKQGRQVKVPDAELRSAFSQLVGRKFLDVKAFKNSFLCMCVSLPL